MACSSGLVGKSGVEEGGLRNVNEQALCSRYWRNNGSDNGLMQGGLMWNPRNRVNGNYAC